MKRKWPITVTTLNHRAIISASPDGVLLTSEISIRTKSMIVMVLRTDRDVDEFDAPGPIRQMVEVAWRDSKAMRASVGLRPWVLEPARALA